MAVHKEEFIEVGSTKVRVLMGGEGEAVLFFHGAGGGGIWFPFMEELSKRFHVIAPEHPGFGLSDDPEWIEDISDLVFFYLDFLNKLGLDKVHLVGHSLGGWLSAELAVAYRERLLSLTLIDAAGIYVPGVKTEDTFMWDPEEAIRNIYYNQEFAEQRLQKEPTSDELDILLKNQETTAKLAWNPRWFNPKLEKRLHRINIPTLIMWGDHDLIFPLEYGHAYNNHIQHANLTVFKDCGHIPHVEKPKEFVQELTAFLNLENEIL